MRVQQEHHFLDHVISEQSITADPSKTQAVTNMERPKNITELRRFMGMANQLGKLSPKLAELSQPLRALLSPRVACLWVPAQEEAFNAIKSDLANPAILALYDPAISTKISADASSGVRLSGYVVSNYCRLLLGKYHN